MDSSAKKNNGLNTEPEIKGQKKKSSLNKKSIENIPQINSIFFQNSLDAMMIGSQDGRIYAANPAACKMLGWNEEEICSLGRQGIVEQNRQLIEAVKKRKESGNFFGELTFIKNDGTLFPVEISSSVFINSDGKEFTSLIIRDITIRKERDRELHETGERYRLLMENSGLGIGYYAVDGKILMFNQQAINNLGGELKDYIGKNLTEVFGKEAGQLYINRLKLAAKSEKPLKFEDEVILNGKMGWYMSTQSRILDQSGKIEGILVTADNITERKIIEERIKTSEAEYRSLFDNSIMGISQAHPGGKFIRINKAYAEMYGYPDTLTMMKEMSSSAKLFSNSDDRKRVIEILDKSGYMPPTEFELNRRNGEKFWALVSSKQVRDDSGNLLYLQAEHIDITKQKKMEEELLKSKELLEKLNQHLMEVRENERYQIALNLHDDLGQKLTAINLNIAWLRSRIGVQSKTVSEKFEEMSIMIKETIESIKETSAFLRPAILFDLGLVPAIKSQLDNFENQTGIKCQFYCKYEEIKLDDKLSLILYRILQESLTNIARHSGAKRAEITLNIIKSNAQMIIKDNGKGIENDIVNSFKSMGIAGMRERVKSVHGKITFSGEPGSGTIIKVIIPLIKVDNDD